MYKASLIIANITKYFCCLFYLPLYVFLNTLAFIPFCLDMITEGEDEKIPSYISRHIKFIKYMLKPIKTSKPLSFTDTMNIDL
ncbi:MAG: hypothetical protein QME51_06485 [Planctomycetota bacterium]|nr:hypothetical protein [Planctomycetota bacterium]